MDVSFLIPTKGRQAQVRNTVYALKMMIPPSVSYEILVRDATEHPVESSIAGASVTYAEERPARAFNQMAEAAQGEFLFPLGDDMRLYLRTITTALTIMRQLPKGTVGIPFH